MIAASFLRKLFFGCLLAMALSGVLAGSGWLWLRHEITKPGTLAVETVIYIPKHTPAKRIISQLYQERIIDRPRILLSYLVLTRHLQHLQAGEYRILPHASLYDVATLLLSGQTIQHKWVIPEGTSSMEAWHALHENPLLEGDLPSFIAEGNLLPETYFYHRGDLRQDLLQRAKKAMRATLEYEWQHRAANLPLSSKEEALTLASIVEKETAIPSERPLVAQVFLNRLRKGIRLQADPTVVYALTLGASKLGRPLSRADLRLISPYNSYINQGLPPGPICNPGAASIHAVLHPLAGEELYFVARGDGSHAFSVSLKEHQNHVKALRQFERLTREEPTKQVSGEAK